MSLSLVELRLKHPVCDFTSFSWRISDQGLEISFVFTLKPLQPFHHVLVLKNVTEEHVARFTREEIDAHIALIGMIECLSYWKAAASPRLSISAAAISPSQATWLTKLLKKGMGEYFYVNDIDFTQPDFIEITSPATSAPNHGIVGELLPPKNTPLHSAKYLIPIGGGKDSVVTLLSLLDQFGDAAPTRMATVMINPNQAQFDTIQGIKLPNFIVERRLDPALFELNEQGYLNGHTPFSAMAAAVTTLVAKVFGYDYVLTSNERSSNEGSVWYRGEYVNHQYSKTLEFESDFWEYASRYLSPTTPTYSSYLRPLYELQIARLFSELTAPSEWRHLRTAFRSCNRGKKTNSWCGNCSKCLFAFVILSPFIELEELTSIFGSNVLENGHLITAALELVGGSPAKPLECVGTLAESKIAFAELIKQYKKAGKPLPTVLAFVEPYIPAGELENQTAMNELLWSWDDVHLLPPELGAPLQARLHATLTHSSIISPWQTVPPILESALKQATPHGSPVSDVTLLIAGFGREGISTYRYLRQALSPTLPIVIVDDKPFSEMSGVTQRIVNRDPHCSWIETATHSWKTLHNAVLCKTPGLPLHHPIVVYSTTHNWPTITNTQLFFSVLDAWLGSKLNQAYKTIGITGTKGKSTTTSLIHHVLKTAKLPVFLGGNIGVPPLELLPDVFEYLATAPHQNLYFVLEMSAHQLSDLRVSPTIAVVQDIVPEHLDYYPDFDTYQEAKSHIVRHQLPQDLVVFNANLATPTHFAKLSGGQQRAFGQPGSLAWVDQEQIITPAGSVMPLSEIPLLGNFNVTNVLPSVVIATELGVSPDAIRKGVRSFRPLPHRLEKVAEFNGILFVNDSLSTIPEAAENAIASLAPRPVILLAGGYDRNLSFEKFAQFLAESNVKKLVLFPPTGKYILIELQKISDQSSKVQELIDSAVIVESMGEAVGAAAGGAQPNDVVLLSPASASFGEFKDYKDRGDQFKLAVQTMRSKLT